MLGSRCIPNEGGHGPSGFGGVPDPLRERRASRLIPAMTRPRTALLALVPVLLHALAREVDRGLGLVLRAEIEPDGLLSEVARAAPPTAWPRPAASGCGSWPGSARVARPRVVAAARRPGVVGRGPRGGGRGPRAAAAPAGDDAPRAPLRRGPPGVPLRLHAARRPDAGLGHRPGRRRARGAPRAAPPGRSLPGPARRRGVRPGFLAYAAPRAGLGVAVGGAPGQRAQVPAPGGGAGPRPHLRRRGRERGDGGAADAAARRVAARRPRRRWRASRGRMAAALARGEAGRDAIRATRITRQTIRGKDGGVYYVLAPGPSLLLAPALRARPGPQPRARASRDGSR